MLAGWVLSGLIFALVWQRMLAGILLTRLQAYPRRWRIGWAVACLLAGVWLAMNIPLSTPPIELNSFLTPSALRLVYRASAGFSIGMALFFLFWVGSTIYVKPKPQLPPPPTFLVFSYALPMIGIWLVYLLAFYPGMMSADSMVQWEQVISGRYNDHHPFFHTLLIWLVTRPVLSPTAVAVAQILTLALTAGAWLVLMQEMGLPRWLTGCAAALFALTPVNGTMVNTLWKDIPYSTAVLYLTLLTARLVFSHGGWIQRPFSPVHLGVTVALVLLLRHDGFPLGIGTLLLLTLAYLKYWKRWLISGLVCAILYAGARGPLYRWIDVQPSQILEQSFVSIYRMAAYVIPGSPTERVVSDLTDIAAAWDCQLWSKLAPGWEKTDLYPNLPVYQAAFNLIPRMPGILLYYYRCARSMEWLIYDPVGEVRNASHVQVLVDPNPFGLRHDSKIIPLRDWIADWVVETARNPNLNWFTWRPAFFLYIQFFITALLILRNRNPRFGLLAVPILLQSVTFSLILAEPNFRYHYAVYLVSLISLPLLFMPPIQALNASGKETETQR